MHMTRFFTVISGFIFLIVAAIHALRLYMGFDVTIGSHLIPMWVSWPGFIVPAFLALMLFLEARRR